MNRGIRLKEDAKLAIALREKLEQWLINTKPALEKQMILPLETKRK
ncbi:hypothetical protein [Entomomonas moraniae]|nr:hypothetical protein [Entomomonas moraniae]